MGSPSKKKAKQEEPKKPPGPSRYYDKLLCLNFIDLIHKYDKIQPKKRAAAMTTTKKHMASRFIKLYKMFRFKKYGEPYKDDQNVWQLHEEDDPF